MSDNTAGIATSPVQAEPEAEQSHVGRPGSLEARVATRREKLETRKTHTFDLPGFEGICQVELSLVGGKRQFNVVKRHEATRDEYQQNLNIGADILAAATVQFFAVNGEDAAPAPGTTWKTLAKAFDPTLGDDVLEKRGGTTVAIIRLLGDDGLGDLVIAWKNWVRTRGAEVERELEDFS